MNYTNYSEFKIKKNISYNYVTELKCKLNFYPFLKKFFISFINVYIVS
jgi:hypothetical protein